MPEEDIKMKNNNQKVDKTDIENKVKTEKRSGFKFKRSSIRAKLTKVIGGISGIISIIVSIIVVHLINLNYHQTQVDKIKYHMQSFENYLSLNLSYQKQKHEELKNNESIIKSITQKKRWMATNIFNSYISKNESVEGLLLIDRKGNIASYSTKSFSKEKISWGKIRTMNFKTASWFNDCVTSKSTVAKYDLLNRDLEATNVTTNSLKWIIPLNYKRGCIIAIENIEIYTSKIYDDWAGKTKFNEFSSFQINIIHKNKKLAYSSDIALETYQNSLFPVNDLSEKFLPSNKSRTTSIEYLDSEHQIVWTPLSQVFNQSIQMKGFLFADVRRQETLIDFYKLVILFFIFVGLGAGGITFLFVIALGYVLKPLKEIDNLLHEIAEGDFSSQKFESYDDNSELGFIGKIINKLIDKIKHTMNSFETTATSVQKSAKNLIQNLDAIQKGNAEQYQIIEESSAAIEEMTAASASIFDAAHRQLEGAQTNKKAMDSLKSSFNESSKKRDEISKQANSVTSKSETGATLVNEFAENMNAINISSKKIMGIISVIDDIADQTNLLALNASIEAARAGKHGKGFSVVANEVSQLAKRSAKSASEIADLIKDQVQKVKSGSAKVETATSVFSEIASLIVDLRAEIDITSKMSMEQEQEIIKTADRASVVAGLAQDISESTKMQTQTAEDINKGMTRINEISSINEEKNKAVNNLFEELIQELNQLNQVSEKFKQKMDTDEKVEE